jgi:Na+-translocating ferredoxin:NAD+ oxidoreductase RNF subunit RnfB
MERVAGSALLQNANQELADLEQRMETLEKQKQKLKHKITQMENYPRSVAIVDPESCTTGCCICIEVCPEGAIAVNQRAVIKDEVCTGCGICVAECPSEAIVIVQKKG